MGLTRILKMVEVLTGLVGIIVLESIALSKGMNGTTLALTIAVISGITGYEFKIYQNRNEEKEENELPEELQE